MSPVIDQASAPAPVPVSYAELKAMVTGEATPVETAPAEQPTVEDQPAPVDTLAEESADKGAEEPIAEPGKGSERTLTQAEVDKAIQKRLAKAEAKHQRELDALRADLANIREKAPETKPEPVLTEAPTRPKLADYADNPSGFDEAMDAYETHRDQWQTQQRASEENARAEQARQQAEAVQQYQQFEAGMQKFEDFDDVISSADSAKVITEPMKLAIQYAGEAGAAILYHLAKNPDEAAKIAGMNEVQQLLAIGRIAERSAATAETPAPKPKPQLPKPVAPVAGGISVGNGGPEYRATDSAEVRIKTLKALAGIK